MMYDLKCACPHIEASIFSQLDWTHSLLRMVSCCQGSLIRLSLTRSYRQQKCTWPRNCWLARRLRKAFCGVWHWGWNARCASYLNIDIHCDCCSPNASSYALLSLLCVCERVQLWQKREPGIELLPAAGWSLLVSKRICCWLQLPRLHTQSWCSLRYSAVTLALSELSWRFPLINQLYLPWFHDW